MPLFRKGDVVRLRRQRYSGQFRECRDRVGRVRKVIRLKTLLVTHRSLTFYEVEHLYPGRLRRLKLLGEDLEHVDPSLLVVQDLTDELLV